MRDGRAGDVVRLSAGDLVPADARLLESRDLSVQQSALTGESLPVDKHASAADAAPRTGPDAPHLVFLGTSVVSGTATAVADGDRARSTMFGDIAARLGTRAPETEFEHGLRRFSVLILRTTVVLVLFILIVGIALKRDPFESLLFAVALGVGLTPEFLPMIASVTLTRGARAHGARRRHRQAPAGDSELRQHRRPVQRQDRHADGRRDARSSAPSTRPARRRPRPLVLAYVNSRFETGIQSPLDAAILSSARRRRQRLPEGRRDPVRLRAAPPVGRRRGAGRPKAAACS